MLQCFNFCKFFVSEVLGAHSTAVRREWKQAGSYEETPMFDPLWRIDVEDGYRGARDRRRANQRGATPVEVLRPTSVLGLKRDVNLPVTGS
jgi:hypothetical protein